VQYFSNYKRYSANPNANSRLDDAPTVSLCIPARNETHALEDCLATAIASDYPKLEIIVLDDCSQDRTSQIIKGFAHDGVRFVKGDVPSDDWLGKNNAYATLAREARGDYMVYMSVDTRVEPQAISRLVSYIQTEKLSMVSVLPQRYDTWRASVLFAPLRYFWQVVLPLGYNTPTATSLWAVHSGSLAEAGGFSAHKDKIMIENVLAKHFFAKSEYHFLVASDALKVWYAKKWSSQVETAIRLWYPSLKKNLFFSLLAIATHFLLFVLPFVSLLISIATSSIFLFLISFSVFLLQTTLFYSYLRRVQTGVAPLAGMVLLPLIAMQEIVLIASSYYQYKRGRVSWKGRNICYPKSPRHGLTDA
jgi:chlorobactene glucosyltransferase